MEGELPISDEAETWPTEPTEMFYDPGDPSTWIPSQAIEDAYHGVGLSPFQQYRRELRRARMVRDLCGHDHNDPSTWGTPEVVRNRHRVRQFRVEAMRARTTWRTAQESQGLGSSPGVDAAEAAPSGEYSPVYDLDPEVVRASRHV